jgi:Flp pilus assembly protein TadD
LRALEFYKNTETNANGATIDPMSDTRIAALRNMIEKDPGDALARRMLAEDLYQAGDYTGAVEQLEAYVKLQEDEGAAYRILGDALVKLGKKKNARWAFRHGAEAARAHNHLQLAEELEQRLREI